VGFSKYVAIK
jgi:hypothetical protein